MRILTSHGRMWSVMETLTLIFLMTIYGCASTHQSSPESISPGSQALKAVEDKRFEDAEKILEPVSAKNDYNVYEAMLGLSDHYADIEAHDRRLYWLLKLVKNPRHVVDSSEPGLPEYMIGVMYLEGVGTPPNQQIGCSWVEKSYKLGIRGYEMKEILDEDCPSVVQRTRQADSQALGNSGGSLSDRKTAVPPAEYFERKKLERQAKKEAIERGEINRQYREAKRANENFGEQALGQVLDGVGRELMQQNSAPAAPSYSGSGSRRTMLDEQRRPTGEERTGPSSDIYQKASKNRSDYGGACHL